MSLADKLRPYVSRIEAAIKAGDEKARQIVTLYEMHRASPSDPAAPALCEVAFDDWMKEQMI